MARKTIMINGVDCTALFPPTGYEVEYIKIEGGNGGQMLSGAYEEDVIAIKAVVSSPLMPLTEEQQGAFLQNLHSSQYANVYYFDPELQNYRSAVMRYETKPMKHRGTGADGNEYWTGLSVRFEDRFDMR